MIGERSFQVELETPGGPYRFDCGENELIWDAASAHDVFLPAICHEGRCLTCAGRLLDGVVDHDHPDTYYPQDQQAGFVLLCRAMPRSNVCIRTHQEWEMRKHRLANDLPAPYA